jgi:hypothetical protein
VSQRLSLHHQLSKGARVQDLKERYEKVLADAAECDLVGSMAADKEKREMFRSLAEQYRRMAEALKQEIDRRAAA